MVAISLYRGNLHRVPDIPRRWLMPRHSISLKQFRNLLNRRSKALSIIQSTSTSATTTNLNPNPHSPPPPPSILPQNDQNNTQGLQQFVEHRNHGSSNSWTEHLKVEIPEVIVELKNGRGEGNFTDGEEKVGFEVKAEEQNGVVVEVVDCGDAKGFPPKDENEKVEVVEKTNPEANNKLYSLDEKDRRRREIEEKLQILNAKKHNLVQALKQILTAEQELKSHSSMQMSKPSVLLQVNASSDSMNRVVLPRMGSATNFGGDIGGGADDVLNHNPHSRQLFCMSSTSPSAESALRRPPHFQHNRVVSVLMKEYTKADGKIPHIFGKSKHHRKGRANTKYKSHQRVVPFLFLHVNILFIQFCNSLVWLPISYNRITPCGLWSWDFIIFLLSLTC